MDAAAQRVQSVVIGTTVATNALLQRRGARVLFVTTAGFEDVPFIGRLDKEELYNLHWRKPAPLVSRRDCYGIPERIGHDGSVLVPLTESALDDLVALSPRANGRRGASRRHLPPLLLPRPEHEQRIKARLQERFQGWPSRSHMRSLRPGGSTSGRARRSATRTSSRSCVLHRGCAGYACAAVHHGAGQHAEVQRRPPPAGCRRGAAGAILISGLAGGIVAARHYAHIAGVDHAFSLDMGGTSADIGTIQGGKERYLSEFQVGFGIPISVTCVDVATLGAGAAA